MKIIKNAISAYVMITEWGTWVLNRPEDNYILRHFNSTAISPLYAPKMGQRSSFIARTEEPRMLGISHHSVSRNRCNQASKMINRSYSKDYMGIFRCSLSGHQPPPLMRVRILYFNREEGNQRCLPRVKWVNTKPFRLRNGEHLKCNSIKIKINTKSLMSNYQTDNAIPTQKMLVYLPVFPSTISTPNQRFTIHKAQNLNKVHNILIIAATKAGWGWPNRY